MDYKIAIGAIFKNEFNYVLEWLAWHQLAGFSYFFVADNESTDGTRALLEALSEINEKFTVLYQPNIEKHAQIYAYNRILDTCDSDIQAILFIDADEFLVHDDHINGSEYELLSNLLQAPEIGMVGINWRTYGSSGLKTHDDRLVLERFNQHASDFDFSNNSHIKSVSKISHIEHIGPHLSNLNENYKRIYINGDELNEFIQSINGVWEATTMPNGIARRIISSPLRVNHYVIKSEEEFVKNKILRGSGMNGPNEVKTMDYFKGHDFYDEQSTIPTNRLAQVKELIENLKESISKTIFSKTLRGNVGLSDSTQIFGWVTDDQGQSDGIKINIFLNGNLIDIVEPKFYRPDLLTQNKSINGFSGFRYHHAKKLSKGDIVEVKIHANNFKIDGASSVVI
jgi:hypothetical protein